MIICHWQWMNEGRCPTSFNMNISSRSSPPLPSLFSSCYCESVHIKNAPTMLKEYITFSTPKLGSLSLSLTLFLLFIYVLYTLLLYPLLFHSLRKIPHAHWSVPFPYVGSLWILYQRYRVKNNATTYEAHRKYGDVVRLGYGEISVNCVKGGVRTVYGGGWEKHDWYARKFGCYGVVNMFGTVHHVPHSQKKRIIANVYSKSSVQSSAQIKANSRHLMATRILPLLQSYSEAEEVVNIHELNYAFTMDFVSAYLFGISCSTNFIQDEKTRREVMHQYQTRHHGDYQWHLTELPPSFRRWMKAIHLPITPEFMLDANRYMEKWNNQMCESSERIVSQGGDTSQLNNVGDEPVVYEKFKNGLAEIRKKDPEAGREYLPHIMDPSQLSNLNSNPELVMRSEVYSEMLDHLEAGHETSAISLTYLYWEVSRSPSMQDRLYAELSQLTPQILWPQIFGSERDFDLPDPRDIDSLPYLHAVFMETLRLHPPIPGSEPRVSPHVPEGSTLGQFTGIPGGTRVSAMPFTLHRNEEVFPNPEVFDPDRWLTSDEERLKEMHRWFWAFGSGGRMCIGSHIATQNMKLLVSAIYSNWKTEIVDDEGIEEVDGYGTGPRSNKLLIRFVHR